MVIFQQCRNRNTGLTLTWVNIVMNTSCLHGDTKRKTGTDSFVSVIVYTADFY